MLFAQHDINLSQRRAAFITHLDATTSSREFIGKELQFITTHPLSSISHFDALHTEILLINKLAQAIKCHLDITYRIDVAIDIKVCVCGTVGKYRCITYDADASRRRNWRDFVYYEIEQSAILHSTQVYSTT